ncbi:MAG TPA: response regulator transcription factor [Gemmatimonadaceae bacterium]
MGDGTTRLKILLADDHALVREGLKRLIDDQPDMQVTAEAGDGVHAVRLAQDLTPDIALVDVSMPGLDGVQATQMITAACPRVKVIALTRHDDGSFVRRLLEAGATGYVLKQSASTELTRAIRAVAAGERYVDSAIRGASAVPPPSAPAAPATNTAELTTDEEQVLRLIALGHSHSEIATRLALDVARVLAIRATATSKTGASSRVAIVRYADARGWLRRS